MLLLFLLVPDTQREKLQMSLYPFNMHYLSSSFVFPILSYSQYSLFRNHSRQTHTRQYNIPPVKPNSCKSDVDLGLSEAEGRTDRQKERERQNVSAYRWRVGAECSPAAPRLPAALSTSPADAGPPRSRSCPSTTGNPVENTAHLLKNTALLTPLHCSSCVTRACF